MSMTWFRVVDTFINPEHVEQITYNAAEKSLTIFLRGQSESFTTIYDPESIRDIFEQIGHLEWLKIQTKKE
jgi:hypothetical protein